MYCQKNRYTPDVQIIQIKHKLNLVFLANSRALLHIGIGFYCTTRELLKYIIWEYFEIRKKAPSQPKKVHYIFYILLHSSVHIAVGNTVPDSFSFLFLFHIFYFSMLISFGSVCNVEIHINSFSCCCLCLLLLLHVIMLLLLELTFFFTRNTAGNETPPPNEKHDWSTCWYMCFSFGGAFLFYIM